MISTFTLNANVMRRIAYLMMAMLMLVAALPMLQPKVHAAQLSTRFIQLSDSANSGTSITTGVGSGTSVTYQVGFTSTFNDGGSGGANSLVIDFCDATSTPIIGDTCNAPAGMNAAGATLGTTITGQIDTADGWSVSAATATRIQIRDDDTADFFGAGAQRFNITGITNPSAVGTFYARITTYNNETFGTYASAASPGNYEDYGGLALSTVLAITITARVQEQLTFCLTAEAHANWLAAGGGTAEECSASEVAAAPPTVVLGHGSPTQTLDSTAVDTDFLYSQLSTNATSGAVINLRTNRGTCTTGPLASLPGGLSADGGTTCQIPPHNAGSGAGATTMTAGTAAFGLFVSDSALGTNGVGSLTPSAAYNDSTNENMAAPATLGFGMDTTTAAANGTGPATNVGNTTTTFGSIIASTTAPTYRVNTTYVFGATASLTTPAGIYTANMSMIATGTF